MKERFGLDDAHAYVDSCLNPRDRREFEAQMAEDSNLRRRVETWHSQNEAIRLAFGAASRPRGPVSLGRHVNENSGHVSEARGAGVRAADVLKPSAAKTRPSIRRASESAARATSRGYLQGIAVAALSAALLFLSASGGPADPRDALTSAGASALRAFATSNSAPMDMSTHDVKALKKWLAPRFPTAPPLGSLDIPGWNLIGARIVPGSGRAAALILFEDERRARLGLMIEPLDAPPSLAARSRDVIGVATIAETSGGYGVVAVGPSQAAVETLMAAREASESP